MFFEGKEFEVKNGLKILIKTPSVDEAEEILNVHNQVLKETQFVLSAPEDPELSIDDERAFLEKHEKNDSYFSFIINCDCMLTSSYVYTS